MMDGGVSRLPEFVRLKKSGYLEPDGCLWNGRSTSANCNNKIQFFLLNGSKTFHTHSSTTLS